MRAIAELVGAVVKAILDAILGKTIHRERTFRDANGDPDSDSVFDDADW
jgi:hypothetical protein